MQHTLRYRSSRGEVWRWYWQAWRQRLWKVHVVAALVLSLLMPGLKAAGHYAGWAVWFVALLPVVIALGALFPQVMFKRAERTLTVDARGWSTRVGRASGARTWAEVASIADEAGGVILTGTNGNALIIPERAFADASARQQFLADIRKWKSACAA